jgi:hypothetical protein
MRKFVERLNYCNSLDCGITRVEESTTNFTLSAGRNGDIFPDFNELN